VELEWILGRYNYWVFVALVLIGFYAMTAKKNLVKKIIGMNIMQTAIFLFYISVSYTEDGAAPIIVHGITQYVNPLPHVLILTAIVVCVSTTAVALTLIMKIYQEYGTLEEDKIMEGR
jgi:multicomponent Na+:H+ antiporter subunit C